MKRAQIEIETLLVTNRMLQDHVVNDDWSAGSYCDLDHLRGIVWELHANLDRVMVKLDITQDEDFGYRHDDHQKFVDKLGKIR